MSQNDDLISRQTAIDAYGDWYVEEGTAEGFIGTVKQLLEGLPPAQPEQRTGYFIGTEFDGYADGSPVYYEWKCSECGCVFEDDEPTYNYCPNCGAKMEDKGW